MARVPRVTSHAPLTAETASEPEAPPTGTPRKALWVAYALHLLGGSGFLGLHRFYLGHKRSACLQLALGATTLLLPLLIRSNDFQIYLIPPTLLWYLADVFLMPRLTRQANRVVSE